MTLTRAAAPEDRLEIYVGDRAAGAPCYTTSGDLSLTISKRTPIRSAAQRRAVETLARLLAPRKASS